MEDDQGNGRRSLTGAVSKRMSLIQSGEQPLADEAPGTTFLEIPKISATTQADHHGNSMPSTDYVMA